MTQRATRRGVFGPSTDYAREIAGGQEPVPARPASTIMVIRAPESAGPGVEVYTHRRHSGMRFAAGMVAFPGGGVDPVDLATPMDDEAGWARKLGIDDPVRARGLVAAAVRELAEETGLVVPAADLLPWANWVTPTFRKRRYDTWFFLLPLPAGAQLRDISGEAESVAWVRPAEELARADAGESEVMWPTRTMLHDLAGFGSVADAVAAAEGRTIEPVLHSWEIRGDEIVFVDGG